MQKYKNLVLVIFVLSVGALIWMNTGTRVVEGTASCVNQSSYCIKVQPEKAFRGRYSEYTGLEIVLCVIAIFTGSAYVYTNLPKRLIRNSIEKSKKS